MELAYEESLALSTIDTATGLVEVVVLRYVAYDGRYYLVARSADHPRWLLRAVRGRITWRVDERRFFGSGQIVRDPGFLDKEIVPQFRAKYGEERFRQWFGESFEAVALVPESERADSLAVEVESMFDLLAPDYDRVVLANPFDRHLREVSLDLLRGVFARGSKVLEIGCGTGLETIPLAKKGVHVVAVDISKMMLSELQRKAKSEGVGDRIVARNLRAADIDALLSEFGPGYFDGAFSTFGALNTEPDWQRLPKAFHDLLKPRGRLVLVVWNRLCLFELVFYSLRLNFRRAFARFRSPVPVGLSRFGVPASAFGVSDFEGSFLRYFVRENLLGLPVILPPYDLGKRLLNPRRYLDAFERLDASLRDRFPFNRLGDHFVLELRRR